MNSPERSGGQWTPRPPPALGLAFGHAPRRTAEAPARWSKLAIDHGKSPSTTTLLLCGLLVSCETASTTRIKGRSSTEKAPPNACPRCMGFPRDAVARYESLSAAGWQPECQGRCLQASRARQWPEVSDFVACFCTLRESENTRPCAFHRTRFTCDSRVRAETRAILAWPCVF